MNPTLVLLAALSAPPTVPPECNRTYSHLSASAAAQGGVALLEVAAGAVEPIATWRAKPLRFWRDDAEGPWRAFIGIDLEQRPGDARVTLRTAHDGPCPVRLPGE